MRLEEFKVAFKDRVIIEPPTVEFPSGEINHLLGKNGSGKTLLAKSCLGMVNYQGRIHCPKNPVVVGNYSNVPGNIYLVDLLKVLKNTFDSERVQELCDLLKLSDLPPRIKIAKMSDGQRQKLKLLSFLASTPQVLFLDEFTTALDQKSVEEIYEFIKKYQARYQVTIINITHRFSDLSALPGNCFIIKGRQVRQVADMDTLKQWYLEG